MWAVLAFAKLGEGARAFELFALLNPINHALTAQQAGRYKVEPYAVAADVYSEAPHVGRGGWTWYTGAAGWMYQAGVEGILGLRREGAFLVVDPCIPPHWPGFEATVKVGGTCYEISVVSPAGRCRAVVHALVDGVALNVIDGRVRLALDGASHSAHLEM
ncbi:MAG TPA: glycosyltransferase 36 associated protein, partial [Ramlibacter sp.]|nr:glycosyltransferase 36 associated protein [Ramlibacter sp.]